MLLRGPPARGVPARTRVGFATSTGVDVVDAFKRSGAVPAGDGHPTDEGSVNAAPADQGDVEREPTVG